MTYQQLLTVFKEQKKLNAELLLFKWKKNVLQLHICRHQKSVLHYSCYNGWMELSVQLIEKFGLDPNFEDDDGNTSLHMACMSGIVALVSYLVKSNCVPFQTNSEGCTALDIAIMAKNREVVDYLIKRCKCDQLCKVMGKKIMTLLYESWDEEVAKCLIRDGGCQVTMHNGTTLLHELARRKGMANRVLPVINECVNCDPFQTDSRGYTVLEYAIMIKNRNLVFRLVNDYACHQLCKVMGKEIMKLLYEHWDQVVAKCLIYDGGCQLRMENGTTLLHEFVNKWPLAAEKCLFLLAECNCNPNLKNKYGNTILHEVCQSICFHSSRIKHDYHMLKQLIVHYKCDPNIRNEIGETVLHIVCYSLLQHGYNDRRCQVLFFSYLNVKCLPLSNSLIQIKNYYRLCAKQFFMAITIRKSCIILL